MAQNAGDLEGAGQAALTIIEELADKLTFTDLSATFERASELLSTSQYPASKDRLLSCARRVLHLVSVLPVPPTWVGFNFFEAVRRYEARLIERALRDADGIIARAAQLLGVRRQSLDAMLHEG